MAGRLLALIAEQNLNRVTVIGGEPTGLILLIATPVVSVAFSIFAFVYQRDRTFVLITTAVLLLIVSSCWKRSRAEPRRLPS